MLCVSSIIQEEIFCFSSPKVLQKFPWFSIGRNEINGTLNRNIHSFIFIRLNFFPKTTINSKFEHANFPSLKLRPIEAFKHVNGVGVGKAFGNIDIKNIRRASVEIYWFLQK